MINQEWVQQFQQRTMRFALSCISLYRALPKSVESSVIGKQLIRCATSVGANYRAACRAKSKPDFIYKLGIVVEEADESVYWLELLVESKIAIGFIEDAQILDLKREAEEIRSVVARSRATAKRNQNQS